MTERHQRTLPVVSDIAWDLNNANQFRALTFLWEGTPDMQAEARPFLLAIAQDPEHLHHMSAITLLWNSDGLRSAHYLHLLAPFLLEIAKNPHSPHRLDAATKLWQSRVGQEPQYRNILRFSFPSIFLIRTVLSANGEM